MSKVTKNKLEKLSKLQEEVEKLGTSFKNFKQEYDQAWAVLLKGDAKTKSKIDLTKIIEDAKKIYSKYENKIQEKSQLEKDLCEELDVSERELFIYNKFNKISKQLKN